MRTTAIVAFVFVGLCATGAVADGPSKKDAKASAAIKTARDKSSGAAKAKASKSAVDGKSKKDGGVGKRERVIDFTKEEEIRGVLTKPEAELIGARRRVQSKSLLPIRLHFIPEMMKTVQEL